MTTERTPQDVLRELAIEVAAMDDWTCFHSAQEPWITKAGVLGLIDKADMENEIRKLLKEHAKKKK